jgi:hypothetical protein
MLIRQNALPVKRDTFGKKMATQRVSCSVGASAAIYRASTVMVQEKISASVLVRTLMCKIS